MNREGTTEYREVIGVFMHTSLWQKKWTQGGYHILVILIKVLGGNLRLSINQNGLVITTAVMDEANCAQFKL